TGTNSMDIVVRDGGSSPAGELKIVPFSAFGSFLPLTVTDNTSVSADTPDTHQLLFNDFSLFQINGTNFEAFSAANATISAQGNVTIEGTNDASNITITQGQDATLQLGGTFGAFLSLGGGGLFGTNDAYM